MQEIEVNGIYKVISTQSGWIIQNSGKQRVFIHITDGVAPLQEPGFVLDPGMILRDEDLNIVGTLYARTIKSSHSSVIING